MPAIHAQSPAIIVMMMLFSVDWFKEEHCRGLDFAAAVSLAVLPLQQLATLLLHSSCKLAGMWQSLLKLLVPLVLLIQSLLLAVLLLLYEQ